MPMNRLNRLRWDLPVPESPIRQSGCPFLIHSQLALFS